MLIIFAICYLQHQLVQLAAKLSEEDALQNDMRHVLSEEEQMKLAVKMSLAS